MTSIKNHSQTSRNKILSKLKTDVAGADYKKLPDEPKYQYPTMSHEKAIQHFITTLQSNHADVLPVTIESFPTVIEEQLKKRNIDSLLYGAKGVHSESIEVYFRHRTEVKLRQFDFLLHDNKDVLFDECPASFTSSRCIISATGTIVLWPSVEEPRTLSLVPPIHFVLVDAQKMVSDFAALISQEHWYDKLPTNVLLISGPSKTADIQQTLAYGAHGPKELIVLLLNS